MAAKRNPYEDKAARQEVAARAEQVLLKALPMAFLRMLPHGGVFPPLAEYALQGPQQHLQWEMAFGVSITLQLSLEGETQLSWGGTGHSLVESMAFHRLLGEIISFAASAETFLKDAWRAHS